MIFATEDIALGFIGTPACPHFLFPLGQRGKTAPASHIGLPKPSFQTIAFPEMYLLGKAVEYCVQKD
jgi:hypothetical protein